jgi:hydrogenase nickel incorporation protein HypA/HybF
MHEVAIARNIVEIVEDVIRDRPEARVDKVYVSIGRMVGVVHASLQFSFNAITPDTALADATLVIEDVPVLARCNGCGREFEMETFVNRCTHCGGRNVQLISGEELLVREIEVH